MEFLFGGGTGCCQADSNKGREASTRQIHLQGRPGFRLVQVLLLAEQRRKFKPSALKCKREGARPGQNPTAAAGRHLCTPNLSAHPPPPSTGASLGHARSTRHRQHSHLRLGHLLCKLSPLNPPALVGYPRGGTSEPPKTRRGMTRPPSPVPKCYFCRQQSRTTLALAAEGR